MAEYNTKGFITKLQPNEIFVFGSNMAGHHIGGAARQAHEQFDAEWGIGEGLTGQTYAFPTLTVDFTKRSIEDLKTSVKTLYKWAESMPEHTFLLTKVGCGIAGYDEEQIKGLFTNLPNNIIPPDDWK